MNLPIEADDANHEQVRQLLRSKHWDSRVAAGDCLGLIAEHCLHHSAADLQHAAPFASAVKPEIKGEPDGGTVEVKGGSEAPLSFQNFEIERVMAKGTVLLASGGTVRFSRRLPINTQSPDHYPLPQRLICPHFFKGMYPKTCVCGQ